MIDAARERLARFGDRVEYVVADLGRPLPIEPARSMRSSRPRRSTGSPTTTRCSRTSRPCCGRAAGSSPNAAAPATSRRSSAALAAIGDGWLGPAHFETPMDTARRLDAAGFVDIECWLHDEPTRFEPGEPLETFLRTVVLGAHLDRLPAGERDAFVREVGRVPAASRSSTTSA